MSFGGFIDFFQKGKVSTIVEKLYYVLNCIYLQTFRPKKKFSPGTLRYSLYKQAQASLSSGINLRTAVQLPAGEDLQDWIAVHGT